MSTLVKLFIVGHIIKKAKRKYIAVKKFYKRLKIKKKVSFIKILLSTWSRCNNVKEG